MKRFTTEGTNDQEGLGLIPAQRRAEEEEAPLDLPFEGGGAAGARRLSRRQALGLVGGSLAGVSLLSFGLAAPAEADLPGIDHNDIITLKCLGDKPGPRYLDGRTQDGTVGLAPNTNPPFTGTKWLVEYLNPNAGPDQYWVYNHIFLSCQGTGPGDARYLDGRTQDGTVGLAPNTNPPFTGTRWHLEYHKDTNPDTYPSHAGYFLHCEGKEPGPRWLDGRTQDGTVGLAPDSNTYKGYTGTRWAIDVVGKSR
jgi:hypothetical protein